MKKKSRGKWCSIRVPCELRDEIKFIAQKSNFTMWKVIELAVFSKAERFQSAEKPRTGFRAPVAEVDLTGETRNFKKLESPQERRGQEVET
jgi:hypothetical protein